VLRLRTAIERARQRRFLGLLLVLLIAAVMLFGVLHDAEHALEDAGFACVAVGVVWVAFAARRVRRPPAQTLVARPAPRPPRTSPPRVAFIADRKPVPLRT